MVNIINLVFLIKRNILHFYITMFSFIYLIVSHTCYLNDFQNFKSRSIDVFSLFSLNQRLLNPIRQ